MLNENEHQQAQAQQEEKNSDTSPCTYDCVAAFFTGKVSCCPCVCREWKPGLSAAEIWYHIQDCPRSKMVSHYSIEIKYD